VNVVPTVAVPAGASRASSLKLSLLARSPDHSRWARRSAIVSYTISGEAFEIADVWVRNGRKSRAIAELPPWVPAMIASTEVEGSTR